MARLPDLGSRGEGWVLVQLALLAAIGVAGFAALPGAGWSDVSRLVEAGLGCLSILSGALLAIRGVLDLGRSLTPFPRPADTNRLVATGAYRWVRHPIYAAAMALWLGWALLYGSGAVLIGFFLLMAGVIVIVPREERALEAHFGESYREYKAAVPRWFLRRDAGAQH